MLQIKRISLPPALQTKALTRLFHGLDGQARFVGGCVRDALLRLPIKDIDMTTSYLPEEVTKKLEAAGFLVVPTGIRFGTVTVVDEDGRHVEVTTLRRDVQCHGRHADVIYTDSYEEDAARRDFTINAMTMSSEGEVYDYFGGMEDLVLRNIRFVGDAVTRIHEDYLRILRFYRFTARFASASNINTAALAAIRETKESLSSLSGERIHQEIFRMLSEPHSSWVVQHMINDGVFSYVELDIETTSLLARVEMLAQTIATHPKTFTKLVSLLMTSNDPKQASEKAIKRLRCSKHEAAMLRGLASDILHQSTSIHTDRSLRHLLQHAGHEKAKELLWLTASTKESINDSDLALWLGWIDSHDIIPFPLKGGDLVAGGVPEGPEVSRMMARARAIWVAADYQLDKEALLKAALE